MAGVSLKDLSEILPTSLLPGHGEKVCLLLLLLCGVVLKKTNHTWSPLKYKNMIKKDKKSEGNNGNIAYDGWIEEVNTAVIFFYFEFFYLILFECFSFDITFFNLMIIHYLG